MRAGVLWRGLKTEIGQSPGSRRLRIRWRSCEIYGQSISKRNSSPLWGIRLVAGLRGGSAVVDKVQGPSVLLQEGGDPQVLPSPYTVSRRKANFQILSVYRIRPFFDLGRHPLQQSIAIIKQSTFIASRRSCLERAGSERNFCIWANNT